MREEQQRQFLPAEHDYSTGDQTFPRPSPVTPPMGPDVTGFDHESRTNVGALLNQGSSFTEANMAFSLQTDSRLYGKGLPKAPPGSYLPTVPPTSYAF